MREMEKKSQDSLASLDCKLEALSQKVEKLEEESSISQPHSKYRCIKLPLELSVSFMIYNLIAASVFFCIHAVHANMLMYKVYCFRQRPCCTQPHIG